MKLFFIADVHGSVYYLRKAIENYKREEADYIVILGDELYHGARNPLPKDYNPKGVAELLNEYKDKIIAVRGNCDSEVDEMVLNYPMMADYAVVLYNNRRLFLTHGHIYNENNLPALSEGDVLIHGHTHVPAAKRIEDIFILNPGSITFPKEESPNSFGVLEDNVFFIKDLEGNVFREISFEK